MTAYSIQRPDTVTGPLSREEFRGLVDAPYGQAKKAIRKHDPLFGVTPGEKIKWVVTAEQDCPMRGTAFVSAASKEEADELGGKLTYNDFDWDVIDCRAAYAFDVIEVEPAE